jgi:hypothetical protein
MSSGSGTVWRAPYPMGIIPTQGPALYLHQPQMAAGVPVDAYIQSELRRKDAEDCANLAFLALCLECFLLGGQ